MADDSSWPICATELELSFLIYESGTATMFNANNSLLFDFDAYGYYLVLVRAEGVGCVFGLSLFSRDMSAAFR